MLPHVKVLTKTRILLVPPQAALLLRGSGSALRFFGLEQPTLVKPIKKPINISSSLTQKHSYRSFQSGTIRGQTSIRYGSNAVSPPPFSRHDIGEAFSR